ncbi:MAG: methyl-accepting chemotaxis protein [Planctomycetaceae bacterium]|nr:methyl-accepting chemotaxis protein [Planctomycetaceae bacterium]
MAEEVRNLAARSAKAAKETADLIEESIRQVGLGSDVAHETSTSLNVITDQVEQINKIVSTISEESDHQAKHLGGVTDTVGQVSAGADATMHSISNVSDVIASINKTAGELEEIVTHFKSNPGGQVMLAGQKYPGFVPGHGAFRNL